MEERDPANPERLRDQIDRGAGRDKVAFQDPAAAPLGTDDEAAGNPVTPEQARMAQEAERRRVDPADTKGRRETLEDRSRRTLPMRRVLVIVAMVIVGVVIIAMVFA